MRKILITGGANGLGHHLTNHFLNHEAHVTILDLEKNGSIDHQKNSIYLDFDLAMFDENLLHSIQDPFDVIICNAGISVSGKFTEIPHDKEKDVFEVNLFGHMQLIKFLLKNHLIKERGRIAFIISASLYLPFPIALAYAASKAALDGFAHALESYVSGMGISITRIYPGPIKTNHSKYYPKTTSNNSRAPEKLISPIVRGIEKRKRTVCPDPLSQTFRILSYLTPRFLCTRSFKFYRERLNP